MVEKNHKKTAFTILMMLLFSSLLVIIPTNDVRADNGDWVIDGNSVYVDDSLVYAKATPHTLYSNGWVEFEFKSKVYTGDVDFAWGFNTTEFKPKKIQLWQNYTHTYFSYQDIEYYNCIDLYDVVSYQNLGIENYDDYVLDITLGNSNNDYLYLINFSDDSNGIYAFTDFTNYGDGHWELCGNYFVNELVYNNISFFDWRDWDVDFDHIEWEHEGMTDWYVTPNQPITQDVLYKCRIKVDRKNWYLGDSDGKYWFAFKPSSETLSEAVSNNHFYCLDPWWDVSWGYKKQITLSSGQVVGSSDLKNFPICINITDSDLQNHAQSDGDDIAFVNGAEDTQLNHEIEEWNVTTGHLVAWINITNLDFDDDTTIYMYYGNAGASSQEDVPNTWNSKYTSVFHGEQDASGDLIDSTSNSYYAENTNSIDEQIDSGRFKLGYQSYFNSANSAFFTVDEDYTNDLTFFVVGDYVSDAAAVNYVWMFYDGGVRNEMAWRSGSGNPGYDNDAFKTLSKDGGGIKADYRDFSEGGFACSLIVDEGTSFNTVFNGNYETQAFGTQVSESSASNTIGNENNGNSEFNGWLDEFRISDTPFSKEWSITEYNSIFNASDGNFFTMGSQQQYETNNLPLITNPIPSNNSVNMPINPIISIDVNDPDANAMNVSFYSNLSGSWVLLQTNSSVNNGTYSFQGNDFDVYNRTYFWNVSVNDGYGTNNSAVFRFRIENAPDIVVSNPSPSNASADVSTATSSVSIDINSNDVFNYTIELGSNSDSGNDQSNGTFSLTGLTFESDTSYKWYVNVSNYEKTGCYFYNFTTAGVNPPTDIDVESYNSTGINLSWTKRAKTSHTYIRHKKGSYPTSRSDGTLTVNTTDNSYNHSGLDVGTVYYYRVWGYNETLGFYSDTTTNVSNTTAPLIATGVSTSNSTQQIILSWTKGTNATNTVIRRNATGDANYPNLGTGTEIYNSTGSTYTDSGLNENITYYYTIWSYQPSFSVFSVNNVTINGTTNLSSNPPSNFSNDVLDHNNIILNWTKGSTKTIIRRNSGSYPTLGTGTEIYNGTAETYTDTGLSPVTHYYYRAWGWNGTDISIANDSTNNITLPEPPEDFVGVYSGTTYTLTWDNGTGVNTTMVRNDTGAFPDYNTGNEVYNGTTPTTTDTQTDSNNLEYYRAWTYAFVENTPLYSIPENVVYGSLEINVYKESNPAIAIENYTIFITNQQGTETYINNTANNPTNIDVSQTPNGKDIAIQISKDGYHTRIKTVDIFENAFYQINFFLPPDVEGGGTVGHDDYIPPEDELEGDNESYSYQYLLTVVDYHGNPIEDAKMNIKRYINTTDSFEDISILYTDTNGQVDVYLIPETIYKFEISKQYYVTEYADYIPSSSIFTHNFRLYYESSETNDTETVFDGITWSIYPTNKYWNNSFNFYFNISSSDNKLEYFILNITYYNTTLRRWVGLSDQNMSSSSGGSLSYTFPNITGKYMVKIFYKKQNFSLYEIGLSTSSGTIFYWIDWGGLSENENLKTIPDFIYFMVLTIIAMLVMAFVFRFAGLGTGYIGLGIYAFGLIINPSLEVAGILGWYILIITAIMYTVGIYLWSRI